MEFKLQICGSAVREVSNAQVGSLPASIQHYFVMDISIVLMRVMKSHVVSKFKIHQLFHRTRMNFILFTLHRHCKRNFFFQAPVVDISQQTMDTYLHHPSQMTIPHIKTAFTLSHSEMTQPFH